MVPPGIPDPAMIVPAALRVQVAEHRIKRKLIRDMNTPVPRHHAHRRAQPAARALAADHDGFALLTHILQHSIAILHCCRIGLPPCQTVTGRVDGHPVLLHQVRRAAPLI